MTSRCVSIIPPIVYQRRLKKVQQLTNNGLCSYGKQNGFFHYLSSFKAFQVQGLFKSMHYCFGTILLSVFTCLSRCSRAAMSLAWVSNWCCCLAARACNSLVVGSPRIFFFLSFPFFYCGLFCLDVFFSFLPLYDIQWAGLPGI